jgi:hypothetical protein
MRRLILLISVGWLPLYLFPSGAYPLTFIEGLCGLQTGTRVTPLTVAAPPSDPWVLIATVRAKLACATDCASASGSFLAMAHMKAISSRAMAVITWLRCLSRASILRQRAHNRSWGFQAISRISSGRASWRSRI